MHVALRVSIRTILSRSPKTHGVIAPFSFSPRPSKNRPIWPIFLVFAVRDYVLFAVKVFALGEHQIPLRPMMIND